MRCAHGQWDVHYLTRGSELVMAGSWSGEHTLALNSKMVGSWSGEHAPYLPGRALREPKMGLPPDVTSLEHIDALFESLDEDHGGTLDVRNVLGSNDPNLLGSNNPNLLGSNDPNCFGLERSQLFWARTIPTVLGSNDPNLLGSNDPKLLGSNDPNSLGSNDPNSLGSNDPGLCPVTLSPSLASLPPARHSRDRSCQPRDRSGPSGAIHTEIEHSLRR